jgi:hypothetical protein
MTRFLDFNFYQFPSSMKRHDLNKAAINRVDTIRETADPGTEANTAGSVQTISYSIVDKA